MKISTDKRVREQHEFVRNSVGWYDFTHQILEIEGPDATLVMDTLCTNNIGKAGIGRARYTMLLNEEGIIQDDAVVFRLEENKYWYSTLHYHWAKDYIANCGLDLTCTLITSEIRMYSVQGPKALELVNTVVTDPVNDLKFFQIADNKVGDIPVKVARAGYTGEKIGYEIYIPIAQVEEVEEALGKAAKNLGGTKVDEVDVITYTLPSEHGMALMTEIFDLNPIEADMTGFIDWNKDFIGKDAIQPLKDTTPKRKLVGIVAEGTDLHVYGGPRDAYIHKNEEPIGIVRKFTYGFTKGHYVGMALIDTAKAGLGDEVVLNLRYPAKLVDKSEL